MDRWTGVVRVSLGPGTGTGGPFFRVAASLLLSPLSKTLIVPSVNAIFFGGDRVEGTGDPVIERLSDPRNVAELLASKLGARANAWVVEASSFNGPFAVYKELVPLVNALGNPAGYDPDGFPAASSIPAILSRSLDQVKCVISSSPTGQTAATMHLPKSPSAVPPPKTIILGFSKGGTVVNQIIAELAHSASNRTLPNSGKPSYELLHDTRGQICPISKDSFLCSISEFHYVDVGLNCIGAYLNDHNVIKKAVENLLSNNASIRFMLHGTPRQWCDNNRPWIRREKDVLLKLLEELAHKYEGKLQVTEKFYFANSAPNLQMHFEIIEAVDIS